MKKFVSISASNLFANQFIIFFCGLISGVVVLCFLYVRMGVLELKEFELHQLGTRVKNVEVLINSSQSALYKNSAQGVLSELLVYIDVSCVNPSREQYVVQVYLRNSGVVPRIRQIESLRVVNRKNNPNYGGIVLQSIPSNPSRLSLPFRGVSSLYVVDASDVKDPELEMNFSVFADSIFSAEPSRFMIERVYSVIVDAQSREWLNERRSGMCD